MYWFICLQERVDDVVIQIDLGRINCEIDQRHTYINGGICEYCGLSRIPRDNYNKFDGWFPYPNKITDGIVWVNYKCITPKLYISPLGIITKKDRDVTWMDFKKLPGHYPKFVYYASDNPKEAGYDLRTIEYYVYKRCNACYYCDRYNSKKMIARIMARVEKLKVSQVFLWTFGTNWKDTKENRLKLSQAWNKLTSYLSNYFKRPKNLKIVWRYKPLFKVIEVGKNGYLHIHAIFEAPIEYFFVKARWAHYVKIDNPNVNFNADQSKEVIKAMSYVAKYVAKGIGKSRNWSFMGRFYGNVSR